MFLIVFKNPIPLVENFFECVLYTHTCATATYSNCTLSYIFKSLLGFIPIKLYKSRREDQREELHFDPLFIF